MDDAAHASTRIPPITPTRKLLRASTEAFIACDVESDRVLSFDEFINIVPSELRAQASEETLRELFACADADGDGTVSQEEYFLFSLRWAAECSGSAGGGGLRATFARFDAGNKDGQVNLVEFTRAMEPYGFADAAHHLFAELDRDGTGTVNYSELLEAVEGHGSSGDLSDNARQLLLQLSFSESLGRSTPPPEDLEQVAASIDASPWHAISTEQVRTTLKQRVHAAGITPLLLWRTLVAAAEGTKPRAKRLTLSQLTTALQVALGYVSNALRGHTTPHIDIRHRHSATLNSKSLTHLSCRPRMSSTRAAPLLYSPSLLPFSTPLTRFLLSLGRGMMRHAHLPIRSPNLPPTYP